MSPRQKKWGGQSPARPSKWPRDLRFVGVDLRGRVPETQSELDARVQVVLPALLIDRTWLILVESVVLQGRVIQIVRVECEAHVVSDLVADRGRDVGHVILVEGGAAVQAAVEARAEVVSQTHAPVIVFEVA